MSLLAEQNKQIFNRDQIERGQIVYGKHQSWEQGKCGLITSVTEEEITIQYTSSIGNSTNYYVIPVEEAAKGEWLIRWTNDLDVIMSEGV